MFVQSLAQIFEEVTAYNPYHEIMFNAQNLIYTETKQLRRKPRDSCTLSHESL